MAEVSNVFDRNLQAWIDESVYIINQGGTSSTKTYSLLQVIFFIAYNSTKPLKIDIVGLSVPHLRDGVLTDMPKICDGFGYDFHSNYQKTEKQLTVNKSTINFMSVDKLGKAHGGRRDILYMNEANHLVYKIAEQLMIRTRQTIFIDFNPTARFWAHDIVDKEPEKAELIRSTYKDNPFLEQTIVDAIESKKGDKNFWRVYGLGEIGYAEGLVFSGFEVKDFDKESFAEYRHGLDWGFSQDPFAYIRLSINKRKKEIYICDEIYKTGLLNSQSAPLVSRLAMNDIVWCDSAEPKSVAEYKTLGVNAKSVKKGQGSIESGIKHIQEYKVFIHPDCIHTLDEFQMYRWQEDKNGDFLPKPEDSNNHIIDALRYALETDMRFKDNKLTVSTRFIP